MSPELKSNLVYGREITHGSAEFSTLNRLDTIDEAHAGDDFRQMRKTFPFRKLCSAASASLKMNASIVARVTQPFARSLR